MAKQRTVAASNRGLPNSSPENSNGLDSEQIATLAYQLWHARGCPQGSPEIDWLEAEKQIRARLEEPAEPQVSEPILVRRSGA